MKPLFVPLYTKYFENFETGKQTVEIRPYGPRWNESTCFPGRSITLSCGYGKQRRIHGVISKVIVTEYLSWLLELDEVTGWHVEAVLRIYGFKEKWILVYVELPKAP